MFRLWAKEFQDNHMLRDTVIADSSDDTRTHKVGSLTLPFKPHNTQILYLSLLLAYFFVKFEKIIRASLH